MKSVIGELMKVARQVMAADEVIATNESGYSWEYDRMIRLAEVRRDDRGRLRMTITETHTKSGLGAGTHTIGLEDVDIGTIWKPRLGLVISLLKKHNFERSSAAWGFKRMWQPAQALGHAERAPLADILKVEALKMEANQPVAPTVEDSRRKLMKLVETLDPAKVEQLLRMAQ